MKKRPTMLYRAEYRISTQNRITAYITCANISWMLTMNWILFSSTLGLRLGLDSVSGWLVVMYTYSYYFFLRLEVADSVPAAALSSATLDKLFTHIVQRLWCYNFMALYKSV